MKNKEIILDKTKLEHAIDMLAGNSVEFLVVDRNLFSLNKISTILKPVVLNDATLMNNSIVIEFAYADKVMPMNVKLISNLNNVSCLEFVKTSQLVNEAQFNSIATKTIECFKENYSYDDEKLEQIMDDVALNETILILTQAVNKEDCENVKNDFISKFDAWKKRRVVENEELTNLMNTLFTDLISLKVWKKTEI